MPWDFEDEGGFRFISGELSCLRIARKLRGIYFIDPEDKELKETIKNARKKLQTSVAHAMPCKIMKIVGVVDPTKLKQNFRVFWKETAHGTIFTESS